MARCGRKSRKKKTKAQQPANDFPPLWKSINSYPYFYYYFFWGTWIAQRVRREWMWSSTLVEEGGRGAKVRVRRREIRIPFLYYFKLNYFQYFDKVIGLPEPPSHVPSLRLLFLFVILSSSSTKDWKVDLKKTRGGVKEEEPQQFRYIIVRAFLTQNAIHPLIWL